MGGSKHPPQHHNQHHKTTTKQPINRNAYICIVGVEATAHTGSGCGLRTGIRAEFVGSRTSPLVLRVRQPNLGGYAKAFSDGTLRHHVFLMLDHNGEEHEKGLAPSRTWVQWFHPSIGNKGSATSRPQNANLEAARPIRLAKNFFVIYLKNTCNCARLPLMSHDPPPANTWLTLKLCLVESDACLGMERARVNRGGDRLGLFGLLRFCF